MAPLWVDQLSYHETWRASHSISSSYSEATSRSMVSWRLISISGAVLVSTLVCPDKVSATQRCTHAESVHRWMILAFHCNARLIPRSTATRSAKLMCLSLCTDQSQLAFSATTPLLSTTRPVPKELASTQLLLVHTPRNDQSTSCTLITQFSG